MAKAKTPQPQQEMAARRETHAVLREFDGPAGRRFRIGERVDAEGWRTRSSLESQRFIRRLGLGDLAPGTTISASTEV